MKDEQCVQFLQWALPRLHMRWPGYRKVRKQVCKRIDRRMRDLKLANIEDYRAYLLENPDEWAQVDPLCRITISRFCRDRGMFATLQQEVLPSLLQKMHERGDNLFRVWSAGCGSGEEPYTLAILWAREIQALFPYAEIDIVATDADPDVMRRACAASYSFGSLKGLPESWRGQAFIPEDDSYCLRPEYKRGILFLEQDIRKEQPDGPFDLVFCRNLVFTYFDKPLQLEMLKRIVGAMHVGGALVIGAHEKLPEGAERPSLLHDMQNIYRKSGQET